jgi:hypothetical protein
MDRLAQARQELVDVNGYRRGRHEGQPVHVDLWAEASGMAPQLQAAVREFGCAVHSGGDYDSLTAKWRMAQEIGGRELPTVLLHVGDLDEHGGKIFAAFAEDVEAFCERDGGDVEIVRTAVTEQQVERYGLPAFDGAVQAEAIPPDELPRIVRDAVAERYDEQIAAAVRDRERVERADVDRRLAVLRARLNDPELERGEREVTAW